MMFIYTATGHDELCIQFYIMWFPLDLHYQPLGLTINFLLYFSQKNLVSLSKIYSAICMYSFKVAS